MLQEISIRNFAIIEDLTIRFESGLTVLSGETGAGKSIIINAVNLLLGSRVSAALIRTGAESAELEALFHISARSSVADTMRDLGYYPDDGLLVRRIISSSDRHRIYINGRLATMQVLTAITADLASISGQHAHQGLLKEDEHLNILDQYGSLLSLRTEYQAVYRQIVPLIRKEQELLHRQARQGEQMDLLRYQRDEIEAACVQPDEDSQLEKERLRLKNSETLFETVRQCVDEIYNNDGAAVERLGYFGKELARVAELDDRLKPRADEIETLTYGLEELASHLRDYLNGIDMDPGQLEAAEARLDKLNKLKRKYGGSLDSVRAHEEEATRQLAEIENIDAAIDAVRAELKACHAGLGRLADALSEKRTESAGKLARAVEQELTSLKMADTRFSVEIRPLPVAPDAGPYLSHNGGGLSESGPDRAAFMIAPNVGEAIKPLAAIASGGELSRIVLALKVILAQNESVETIVFDEVDAGIGGMVAELVGKKLANLARHHQILCITHLPQIAKYADHHFCIVKAVSKGRTHTTITPLSAEERVEELARMLGGEKITSTTRAHAKEMLATASAN
jgi:DNA repair protein RecN (Recombination protein N)